MTKDKGQYLAHNVIEPEIKNNKLHVTGGEMNDFLKPCPFCGSEGAILDEPFYEDEYGCFCNKKCGAVGPCDEDGEKAIEFWNTRPIEDELRAEIDRLQAERRWIPVSERLPECEKAVLIMTTTSVLPRIGRHSPTTPQWATTDMLYYHDISYSEVTHWMPLPEPPESEE